MTARLAQVCRRCGRLGYTAPDLGEWLAVIAGGRITGYICPDCTTVLEALDADLNRATGTIRLGPLGLHLDVQ